MAIVDVVFAEQFVGTDVVFAYQFPVAVEARHSFELDFDSPLWWKRRPKRISDDEAAEALKAAAKVIKATAKAQAEERIPEAQRKWLARKAIEPIALQMPGFDWRPMYEQAYSEALTQAILAAMTLGEQRQQALARQRADDDAIAILMML